MEQHICFECMSCEVECTLELILCFTVKKITITLKKQHVINMSLNSAKKHNAV